MEEVDEKFCQNCRRDIPVGNFEIHFIHCKRNIELCEKCQEPVHRSALTEHDAEFHTVVKCSECRKQLENSELYEHQTNECPKRLRKCQYCELELKADELNDHEDYCGSRTENCDDCGKLVMIKFQQLHLDSNHMQTKPDEINDRLSDDDSYAFNGAPNRGIGVRDRDGSEFAPYDVDELFQNMQLRNTTARINEHIRRNAHVPLFGNASHFQPPAQVDVPVQDDEIYIPCEFCDMPIVADQLVLHQTGCRPDLSSFQSQKRSRRPHVNLQRSPNRGRNDDNDDILIPCEFCGRHFSLNFLGDHQMNCRRSATTISDSLFSTTNQRRRYVDSDDDY